MSDRVVQGLWIGPELSALERLSAASFLAHGHEYHLYVYEEVRHVPAGVRLRDANEILPASAIFQYRGTKSYAGFANHFRYELLLRKGGWWADTDVVCLKPFGFESPYVFASEPRGEHGARGRIANNGIIKAPAASELLAHLCRVCRAKDPEKLVWGETGPRLLDQSIKDFALDAHLAAPQVFCPLAYTEWAAALDPSAALAFGEGTYAVHLWNEMWRRDGRDKNARYHPDCLYERLKRKYLV